MSKRICFTSPDGAVSVVLPAPGARLVEKIALNTAPRSVLKLDPPERLEDAFAAVGLGRGWNAGKIALVNVVYAETETEFIARVRAKSVPGDATNVHVIEEEELPTRNSLRNAWRQIGSTAPHVDMPVARAIKTGQIRIPRNERLKALDIAYMRADEAGNLGEKARIAGVKQKLRDLPETIQPTLDAIATPEALEAHQLTWPT